MLSIAIIIISAVAIFLTIMNVAILKEKRDLEQQKEWLYYQTVSDDKYIREYIKIISQQRERIEVMQLEIDTLHKELKIVKNPIIGNA